MISGRSARPTEHLPAAYRRRRMQVVSYCKKMRRKMGYRCSWASKSAYASAGQYVASPAHLQSGLHARSAALLLATSSFSASESQEENVEVGVGPDQEMVQSDLAFTLRNATARRRCTLANHTLLIFCDGPPCSCAHLLVSGARQSFFSLSFHISKEYWNNRSASVA